MLAGYLLLFTTDDATTAQADSLARALAAAVGTERQSLQTVADYRPYLITRIDDSTRIDSCAIADPSSD